MGEHCWLAGNLLEGMRGLKGRFAGAGGLYGAESDQSAVIYAS